MSSTKLPREARGFSKGKSSQRDVSALAIQCVKESRWNDAIELYKQIEETTQTSKTERVNHLFNAALQASNSNNNIETLILHCQLLGASPNHRDGLRNFAITLRRLEHYNAAKSYIDKYLELKPECANGLNTLGTILTNLGQNYAAIDAYKKSLKIDPQNPLANSNLANEYHLRAKIDLAFIHSSRAIAADPSQLELWLDHFTQLARVCAFDLIEKINWWALLRKLPAGWISSSFLNLLTLCVSKADQQIFKLIVKRWGDQKSQEASQQPLPTIRNLSSDIQKLKIGFLSADFRNHSVARFIWPLFEHLDRNDFSLFCYSTYFKQDAWRQRFEENATAVHDVAALSPQDLCSLVRDDGIHVLFDLTGFTNGSRTGALAWRAAPIQVSWLGFPGTSGLPQMDYLFLDQYLAPSEPDLIHEKALITNGTTVCFSDLADIPITPIIPELQRGFLTLGTLNNSYKITRATISRWANVLHHLPTARFLFVRQEFQSYLLRRNILNEFRKLGIQEDRINFYNNRLVNRHYLDCYNEIDFSLDTFPVTGGTTTTDALWMGVPVVALEGPNIHQRVCSAILQHAGHPEWIAQTDDEFTDIALRLAENQNQRIELRQNLRQTLQNSLLCNPMQFAQDFKECMEKLRIQLQQSSKI